MSALTVTLPFWLTALGLTAAAVAAVCIPLLRDPRTQEAGASSGRARQTRWLAALVAILLPATALVAYLAIGNPSLMMQSALAETQAQHAQEQIAASIRDQTAHLEAHPEDALAWMTLGMTYAGLERWVDAEQAYAKAYALQPKDAFVVSAYAEALAVNAGRNLAGRPIELVREALLLSSQDEKALELAALHAFQEQEYGKAAYYFRQQLKVLPPDSPYAADIQAALREAKWRAEEAAFGAPLDQRPPEDAQHGAALATISGVVELAPELAERVTGKESLYLIARPVSGGGPQLAGLRATADRLPAPFTLDDSLALLPDDPLSQHATVTLIARIAMSDSTEPTAGDLEGQLRSVTVGSQGVRLVIDSVRP
ncbi:MAG: c-type cytochrome biogenesis protein CcmI [Sphingobacteriia bacterium]|nr:c-type cytochrome biogenesis protein CcmI [Sphingobacteriia bacterium]NCC40976.1 c-type cytochrome biogenesis protein CcmI [Gammaproteobacteria bacterium]